MPNIFQYRNMSTPHSSGSDDVTSLRGAHRPQSHRVVARKLSRFPIAVRNDAIRTKTTEAFDAWFPQGSSSAPLLRMSRRPR